MSEFPHLANASPEFISLADVEATVHGVTIPLHSHVLAKSSKVFAQFFASFTEGRGVATPISVTRFFDGESLKSVMVTLVIFYEPTGYCVEEFLQSRWPSTERFTWGGDSYPRPCDPLITPQVLQSVIKLLDKLDAAPLLGHIDDSINYEHLCTNSTPWYGTDPVGYFLVGQSLGLIVGAVALECILDILMKKPPSRPYQAAEVGTANTNALAAAEILADPRWHSEPSMLLLVIEAMSVHHARANDLGHLPPQTFLDDRGTSVLQNWSEPGDLLRAVFDHQPLAAPDNEGAAAPPAQPVGGPVVQAGGAMALIEEVNQEQAAEDWMNEFDAAQSDDDDDGDDHAV